MDQSLQNTLLAQLKALPLDVQKAILSVDFEQHLARISQKHGLQVDQMTALENETMFILLGMEHPRDYIRNLSRELEVDALKAGQIAQEINETIFRPIRESLKKIHEIQGEPSANIQRTTDNKQDTTYKIPASAKGYGGALQDTNRLIDHEGFHDEKQTVNGQRSTVIGHQPAVTETAPSNLPVEEDEGALTHEQVLAELEHHSKAGKNIVEERLQNIFVIPSTKTEHKEIPVPKKESAQPAPEKNRGYGADPYREYVE